MDTRTLSAAFVNILKAILRQFIIHTKMMYLFVVWELLIATIFAVLFGVFLTVRGIPYLWLVPLLWGMLFFTLFTLIEGARLTLNFMKRSIFRLAYSSGEKRK